MAIIEQVSAKSRLATYRIGLWLLILSDSFFFGALIASRYYILGFERPADLNQVLGFVISLVLLLSSLTAYLGESAAAHDDEKRSRRNLIFTIALGGLFVIGVGVEWYEAFHFFAPTTAFGAIFFTLTGFHALHVITGLIALVIIVLPRQRGKFTSQNYFGVEAAVKYWHFVDVAWVFIFPTLYLVS